MDDTIEDLVQHLIRDDKFREAFYRNPTGTIAAAHIAVSPAEVASILSIPSPYFAEFARALPSSVPEGAAAAWSAARVIRRH